MPQETEKQQYVKLTFPAAFVHPYEHTDSQGKTWDKAIANFPPNMEINGVSMKGFSTDFFARDFHIEAVMNNEPVTFSVPADKDMKVFKKSEDGSVKSFEVNPWEVTKALKASREEYKANKQAERSGRETATHTVAKEKNSPTPEHDQKIATRSAEAQKQNAPTQSRSKTQAM